MTPDQLKQAIQGGEWMSIAPEVRPSISKNADGSAKPFYLTRIFSYSADDTFALDILNSVDPYGKVPLVKMSIKGHITWQGDHPIAPGAQNVYFAADEAYEVTPLLQGFADAMNVATKGFDSWKVGEAQSILKKSVSSIRPR